MKKLFLAILPLFLLAEECSKCSLNKDQMKCEYYVAKKGDISHVPSCKRYADYLERTKVYGKASWYYLLSKEPKKAIESGKKALKMGEGYVAEYIAEGYFVLGDQKRAQKYLEKYRQRVGDTNFFIDKNLEILQRIYKDFDRQEAKELIK